MGCLSVLSVLDPCESAVYFSNFQQVKSISSLFGLYNSINSSLVSEAVSN